MMRVLFVDHAFHGKTRSSDFFYHLLERHAEVERLYIDPVDRDAMQKLAAIDGFDLVVLWQMDFLAPLLLARGVRTVVVPMYDGSSSMPDLHWLWSSRAAFINFSRRLHDRLKYLNCPSLLVKYFLPPVPESERPQFTDLKALLWQRRPEHGIHLNLVERLLSKQVSSIHIHDVPDDPGIDSASFLRERLSQCELTVSRWFPDRNGFQTLLSSHNVLIAPRRTEGIGMVMLEGLARGMVVLASDAATHDEYISHECNGILFDPDKPTEASLEDARALGDMAWQTAAEGHTRWLQKEPAIIDFLRSVPQPEPMPDVDVDALARSLVRAYVTSVDNYRTYLLANARLIERMSGRQLAGQLNAAGEYDPFASAAASRNALKRPDLPWLEQNRADAGALSSRRYIMDGAVKHIANAAWVAGQGLKLNFRLDPRLGVTNRLKVKYQLPPEAADEVPYCIMLNGTTLGIGRCVDRQGVIECALPPHAVRHDNELHLQFGGAFFAFGAAEPLSIGLEGIEFS